MNRLLTLLLASAVTFLGQSIAPTTGSVSGRVLDTDTNLPIPGIRVDLSENRDISATTDSEGRYTLRNLPPGKHSIEVYDGSLAGISLTPTHVALVVGGREIQVDIHTRHFSQIAGRVLDNDGNPLAGIQVSAIRKEFLGYAGRDLRPWIAGEAQLAAAGASVTTDDQGRYVLRNLASGRSYWIAARSPKRYTNPISDAPADPLARKRVMSATYYPSATSSDTAIAIVPHSQETHDGVDIRMVMADSYCLEATLTEGGLPGSMSFLLVEKAISSTQLPSVNLPGSSLSGRDGKIRLCDLYPGQFQLIAARLSTAAQESMASIDITITDKDVRDLVVSAVPPSMVSGEFVWEKSPIQTSSQSIQVRTYPAPVLQTAAGTTASPGTFALDVFAGSPYILALSGLDSHSYVKEISYGGSQILHRPFVPGGGDAKLKIAIGSDAGSIAATVRSADGPQPQVLQSYLYL